MIQAITFDLWDTVIHDDSDEPTRAARGLPSKRERRRELAVEALAGTVEPGRVAAAFDEMERAFSEAWHGEHVTWTVTERIGHLERALGTAIAPGRRGTLVTALEEMELDVPPAPVPGIVEAIPAIAARYPLGVVSDAIYSPGRCLRRWLEMHGLLEHFRGFAFSDEVGHSKPHESMFRSAADQLGVSPGALVHIGDRESKDIAGAHALGMRAVLITVTRADDRDGSQADAVCEDAAELPAIIERLAGAAA